MGEIPPFVYIAIGTIVVANIGTIVTVLFAIFKGGRWVGKTELTLERHAKDIDAAHNCIRENKKTITDIIRGNL